MMPVQNKEYQEHIKTMNTTKQLIKRSNKQVTEGNVYRRNKINL